MLGSCAVAGAHALGPSAALCPCGRREEAGWGASAPVWDAATALLRFVPVASGALGHPPGWGLWDRALMGRCGSYLGWGRPQSGSSASTLSDPPAGASVGAPAHVLGAWSPLEEEAVAEVFGPPLSSDGLGGQLRSGPRRCREQDLAARSPSLDTHLGRGSAPADLHPGGGPWRGGGCGRGSAPAEGGRVRGWVLTGLLGLGAGAVQAEWPPGAWAGRASHAAAPPVRRPPAWLSLTASSRCSTT